MQSPRGTRTRIHIHAIMADVWDIIFQNYSDGYGGSCFWNVFNDIRVLGKLQQVSQDFKEKIQNNTNLWRAFCKSCDRIPKSFCSEIFMLPQRETVFLPFLARHGAFFQTYHLVRPIDALDKMLDKKKTIRDFYVEKRLQLKRREQYNRRIFRLHWAKPFHVLLNREKTLDIIKKKVSYYFLLKAWKKCWLDAVNNVNVLTQIKSEFCKQEKFRSRFYYDCVLKCAPQHLVVLTESEKHEIMKSVLQKHVEKMIISKFKKLLF